MKRMFQVHEYFNFKTCIRPRFDCIYVSYWRFYVTYSDEFPIEKKKILAQRIERLLTDEFCALSELNVFEGKTRGFLSWVIANGETYIFKRPNPNYLEIAILKEKVSDFENHLKYIKSSRFETKLRDIGKQAAFAFAFHDGDYKWSNTLKY